MRNRVLVAVGVVVLVVAALIGWRSCDSASKRGSSTAGGSASTTTGGDTAGTTKTRTRGPVVPASLAGRVIEKANGRGIPGAVVSIARASLMREIMPTPEASLVVVTDAQGAWKVTPVLPGTYFLSATAVGFVPAVRDKHVVGSGDVQTNLEIALDAGGTFVSGTVTDVLGGPIAIARVTAHREDVFDLAGFPDLVAITKDDGTYQLTLAEGEYELKATHDDYTSSRANVEVATTPITRDFMLTPGAGIRGQVIARDSGKPVPGAWLLADGSGEATARGDDAGNFVFRGLRPGAVSLRAQGPGYASVTPTVVELGIGEQIDGVKVLVDHAFSISGTVVRKGKPDQGVPGVQLGVFSLATQQFGLALEPTDDTGAFVIHGVRPASYMLFAGGEGNVPELGTNVDVVDKDVTDVKVEMSTGVTLAGRVEPPVAGARVTLSLDVKGFDITKIFEAMKTILVHGETNADGTFTVANAPAGAFTLTAAAKSGDTGTLAVVVGEVDQRGLVVKLETRASISGRVVNDKGAPVADATVSARSMTDEPTFSMGNNRRGGTTRPDGSFKIVGLDAGSYSLGVRDNDRNHSLKLRDGKQAPVVLAKAQAVTNLVLTVESRDGVIRGIVIGGDKKPVADAWVTAEMARPDFTKLKKDLDDAGKDEAKKDDVSESWRDYEGPSKPVLTGTDGRFTLDRLRRGTPYTLVAEGPRGASRGEVKDIKAGSSATITLLSLGTLTGKVTSDDGKPVTAYDLACDAPDQDDNRKTIDAKDGTYTLERLAPASYACTVTADAGTATGKIDVPPGPAKLDLQLTRWGVITGRVVDVLSKKPVPGLMAMNTGGMDGGKVFEDMMRGRTPKTDANGVFTLARVPAGSGNLTIMNGEMTFSGGDALAMKPYTITAGQRIDLGIIEVVAPRVGDAGTFGFATTIDDTGKLVVSSVKADGPAALAGVREQDQIVAVAGIPIATLTAPVAQKVLSSGTVGVGIPITLTLDRAGSPVEVALVSVKW